MAEGDARKGHLQHLRDVRCEVCAAEEHYHRERVQQEEIGERRLVGVRSVLVSACVVPAPVVGG